jgi:hypothetical protein
MALGSAVALIKGAVYFEFRETLSMALPMMPILFPLFYRILHKDTGGGTDSARASSRSPSLGRQLVLRFYEMRSLQRVFTAVALSLALKFAMEGLFLYTFYRKSGLPFNVLFGRWEDDLLGRFLRGDLLVVTASQAVALLLIEAMLLTAIGGLWIGVTSTSASRAIVEALCAGTILAFFATLTNLSLLFARAQSMASAAVSLFGSGHSQTLALAGPLFQVFLYGCWTLVGLRCRRELSMQRAAKSRRPSPSHSH